jgi:hypothetical protein
MRVSDKLFRNMKKVGTGERFAIVVLPRKFEQDLIARRYLGGRGVGNNGFVGGTLGDDENRDV